MAELDDRERLLFEKIKALQQQANPEQGTGDASLDMLLVAMQPSLRRLVQNLAIPHWFDEQVLAAIERDPDYLALHGLDGITGFSFVRSHPHGYAYHDLVRGSLLGQLMRQEPERIRQVSRCLLDVFRGEQRSGDEDIIWEHAYLKLVCDEEAGFQSFEELFMGARGARRFAVCDTLVGMAAEQRPLLSREANFRIDYYQGLLAFDIHNFEDAETIFRRLVAVQVSSQWADRAQLYMGLTLEAQGLPEQAEQIYRAAISRSKDVLDAADFSSRLYDRLAKVSLALGNLVEAEEHVHKSLRINERAKNLVGQALNYETLGHVYERLRDLSHSRSAFNQSLALFSQAGRELDKARVYGSIATLLESFSRWAEAEAWYKKALQARADVGDDYGLGIVYANLGGLYLKQGQAQESLKYFQTALQAFQRFRDRFRSAQVLHNMALTFERLGHLDAAIEHIRKAIQELPEGHRLKQLYQDELVRLESSQATGRAKSR